jgi:MFS family permease
MIALVAVLALGSALTQPAMFALTPEMVRSADLPKAMSIMQTAGTVGMLGGPALGGLLTGAFGSRTPLLLDAASFLALAVAGLAIRSRRGGRHRVEQAPTSTTTATPIWTLRGDRLARTLLISLAAVVASVTAVTVAEVFFVRGTLGSSPAMYGVISSMWELGILIGVWPFGRLRGGDDRLARAEIGILAVLSLLLLGSAVVPAAGWLVPIYLVGGTLNGGLNVIVGIIIARRVPRSMRGRVGGTFAAVAAGANFAGYAAGGALLPLMTPRSLIALSAGVSLVVALAFLISSVMPRARRTATPSMAAPSTTV